MRVHLHPQGRTLEVAGRRSVGRLLAEIGVLPGTAMVIRQDVLLLDGEMVEDDDVIEVRAVISGGAAMKCTRCRARAEVHLRAHNAGFCRPCFIVYFRRHVERAIAADHMCTTDERILVAVSGGKDSLALWDVLVELGYRTTGLYLAQGIGAYSDRSRDKVEAFASARALSLRVVDLDDEGPGLAIPDVAGLTRRSACSACGMLKRHFFDEAALAGEFDVLATGHNLDDEAARLLGNVLRWQVDHLARQRPVLPPTHPASCAR